MQEKLLQFIWQYSLYRPDQLQSTEGITLQVIHPGTLNRDAGPDFSNARIRMGNTIFAGNVELHVCTSDWIKHGHEQDAAYKNIILHVVFQHDMGETNPAVPVLELGNHIPDYVLAKYSSLLQTTVDIPCNAHLPGVGAITKESWLNRLLVERWENKLSEWTDALNRCSGNWQELFYMGLAQAFGFKVNAVPFKMLAESLPFSIVQKQASLFSIEALLFGQAGMLNEDFQDEYPKRLKEEYGYLRGKCNLQPIATHLWKYLRMRPPNFPSIRIAQFAAVLHHLPKLFNALEQKKSVESITALLDAVASEYWNTHYRFDEKPTKRTVKKIGESSAHSIIINVIAPATFLYAYMQGKGEGQEHAMDTMEKLPSEDNNVIRRWRVSGMAPVNAAQSQALLQLYNFYCAPKRCLECAIGLKIIKSGPDKDN